MNSQIIIDFPLLAVALFMYFSMKGLYKLLCYFFPTRHSSWSAGYIEGHNALAAKLRPQVDKLVEHWEKIQAHDEHKSEYSAENSSKNNDCKIPRQEQNLQGRSLQYQQNGKEQG